MKLNWRLMCYRVAVVLLSLTVCTAQHRSLVSQLPSYVGTYIDRPGHTLEIVAGDELFAVQDEAKYRLHSSGTDQFTTAGGGRISFHRDALGNVDAYEERGQSHPRVSRTITPESAALAYPRPLRKDAVEAYEYREPTDLHDGIAVGQIEHSSLGLATADRIVQGVLDGTFEDVHSVLLYQYGKLVLEEFFYGYNARRQHQLRSATKSVVSALAGIAVDQGALQGVGERVLPRLSYTNYANSDPRKSAMTLGNFLSMASGLDCNDHSSSSPGRETVIDETPDWLKRPSIFP